MKLLKVTLISINKKKKRFLSIIKDVQSVNIESSCCGTGGYGYLSITAGMQHTFQG